MEWNFQHLWIPDSKLKLQVRITHSMSPRCFTVPSPCFLSMNCIMKLAVLALASLGSANAFMSPAFVVTSRSPNALVVAKMSTMAEAGVPPSTSDASDVAEIEIPTNLPSEKGVDYVPLATMLAAGQLAEADQVGDPVFR
jgi:hypothetical protein